MFLVARVVVCHKINFWGRISRIRIQSTQRDQSTSKAREAEERLMSKLQLGQQPLCLACAVNWICKTPANTTEESQTYSSKQTPLLSWELRNLTATTDLFKKWKRPKKKVKSQGTRPYSIIPHSMLTLFLRQKRLNRFQMNLRTVQLRRIGSSKLNSHLRRKATQSNLMEPKR